MSLSDKDRQAALYAYCERFGVAYWYACRIAEHKDESGLDERDTREFVRLENWLRAWELATQAAYERYREVLALAMRAIGDHNAPNDCYATGPMTGDVIKDLVECPACVFLAEYKDLEAKNG